MELVDRWVTVEARELGAEVEPLGLRSEAESGPRRLEAEVRDTPAPATLEDGRPTGLAPYRWGAEGERGGLPDDSGGGGRSGREGGHFRGAGTGGHIRGAGTG